MGGARGDGKLGCQLNDGWQGVAGFEASGSDVGSQGIGDGLIGAARDAYYWLRPRDDLSDSHGRLSVRLLDPRGVGAQRCHSPATVPEPARHGSQVDASGQQLHGRVVA